MTENPYQSPQSDPRAQGVVSGRREDVFKVATYQRGLILCILAYLVLGIFQVAVAPVLPDTLRVVVSVGFAVAALVTVMTGAVFVFQLAIQVYDTALGIVLGVLALIPCLGIFVLLFVNGKATSILRANGFKVGFFGAKGTDAAPPQGEEGWLR